MTDGFVFVDTAIGGPDRRNNVVRADEFAPPVGAVDCFTTWLLYPRALVDHVAATRNAKDKPTVAGYSGPALALRLLFDFDDEDDPTAAQRDARTLYQAAEKVRAVVGEAAKPVRNA